MGGIRAAARGARCGPRITGPAAGVCWQQAAVGVPFFARVQQHGRYLACAVLVPMLESIRRGCHGSRFFSVIPRADPGLESLLARHRLAAASVQPPGISPARFQRLFRAPLVCPREPGGGWGDGSERKGRSSSGRSKSSSSSRNLQQDLGTSDLLLYISSLLNALF
jgi:hypothetical protein